MPSIRTVSAVCLLALPAFAVLPTTPLVAAEEGGPRVQLTTNAGNIVLELDEDRAPVSVDNFLTYVDDRFYDGTIFHRVIEGFMIQGGGFTADQERKPTRDPIVNEASNGLSNRRYTISMARTHAPHSATAQFFINTVDNGNLDYTGANPRGWGYAVFGRVVEGQDVVDAISTVRTGPSAAFSRDVPLEPIVIESAQVIVADETDDDETDAAVEPAAATPVELEKTKAQ